MIPPLTSSSRYLLTAAFVLPWACDTLCGAEADLADRIVPLIERHQGHVAIALRHLDTGVTFRHNADEPMPTASMIKFPVMIEAYRQGKENLLKMDAPIALREEDKVPGSGILTAHFSSDSKLALRDAIRLMIAYSDNTATNLVIDQIGLRSVNETMDRLDCPNTRIHSKVFLRETSILPERSRQFGLGSTTANEMIKLFELLHRGKLVNEWASSAMLEHLRACQDRDKLVRELPDGTPVAHKSGSVARVRADAGIIDSPGGPIALCVLTAENRDRRRDPNNDANRLCAKVARAAYDHFNRDVAVGEASRRTTLRLGASGPLVESLQRTLNARLKLASPMAIDGDFGPMTRQAVLQYQEAHGLDATGDVEPEMWQSLGTLVTDDPPVPDPDDVNRQSLPRAPVDPLDGPPWVTCTAWAVGDGRSGELLWGDNESAIRDPASTTKVMTAYVVLKLARQDPTILDESVVFSKHADATKGSTAGVRQGERLAVKELLYGLLLPSGNDASVALAEHFGARFEPPDDAAGQDRSDREAPMEPYDRFIAQMNLTARSLGMSQTQYRNPHGLTAEGHVTSARDMLRLSSTAMRDDRFRQLVQTRMRGCRLAGPGGYHRNVVWKNTNRLLAIEGYEGVKTGTTSAAGACLVSFGQRSDRSLIVVVLGATSSDARYVDTRNLFRWAWKQRGGG